MSGMALLFLLRHMLFVNFGLGDIHKQHRLYNKYWESSPYVIFIAAVFKSLAKICIKSQ